MINIKYFGTDGIRGNIDQGIDSTLAYNVGKAIACDIIANKYPRCVIIGKDTRVSGDLLSYSIAVGLMDYGIDVRMVGIISTGGVSYLTSRLQVGYGVMVTASHNPANMNGIKVMDRLGYKIDATVCTRLEKYMDTDIQKVATKGHIFVDNKLVEVYQKALCDIVDDLHDVSVVVDTSYGSMGDIAPKVLRLLGANVIPIHTDTDKGNLVNSDCGALHPDKLQEEVLKHKCDIGIGFDGDADRLVVVDRFGNILSGDEIIYILAKYLDSKKELNSKSVVGTIMTNMGLEKSLNRYGIKLLRTQVGDGNVIDMMRANNLSLGGESSGHICIPTLNTTCDAFMNALYLLKIQKERNISDYLVDLQKYPQIIKSFPVKESTKTQIAKDEFTSFIQSIKDEYDIRVVVRPSGTENLLRVMVEGKDSKLTDEIMKKVIKRIEKIEKTGI